MEESRHYTVEQDLTTSDSAWAQLKCDTWIVPSLQLRHVGMNDDHCLTLSFLDSLTQQYKQGNFNRLRLTIATGYFNSPPSYCNRFLQLGTAKVSQKTPSSPMSSLHSSRFEIVTASPAANGFFGANSFLASIPLASVFQPSSLALDVYFAMFSVALNLVSCLFSWPPFIIPKCAGTTNILNRFLHERSRVARAANFVSTKGLHGHSTEKGCGWKQSQAQTKHQNRRTTVRQQHL